MPRNCLLSMLLAALLAASLAGCSSAPVLPPEHGAPAAPVRQENNTDQARLKDSLTGSEMPPGEIADLSDRVLANDGLVNDQETMARLELALLKAIKNPDKTHKAVLWRNLGIIHYHQKKYKQARQELQASNELNPKNARTHFYLARLFANLGEISEKQGKVKMAKQQFKRAAIEMEMARKIEPGNPLYRDEVKPKTGRQ